MAVEVYLGNPPARIVQWIKDHSGPVSHPETRFTLQDGTVETYNITGTLDQQWMIQNGYFDEDNWKWIKTITQSDIGNTVTSIGGGAFMGCSGLTNVTIPDSVTSVGNIAFNSCSSLMSVTIPDSVTIIGNEAFYDCSNLTSVTIGNSVTSIGDDAFSNDRGLTSMTIPDSVTSIGTLVFNRCSGLMSVTFLEKTIEQIQGMNNYPWGIEDTSIIKVA